MGSLNGIAILQFFLRMMLLIPSTYMLTSHTVRSQVAVNELNGTFDALNKLLPSSCFHTGKFIETKVVSGFTKPLSSEGEFIYSCQNGLVWSKNKPIKQASVYLSNGKYFSLDHNNAIERVKGRVHRELGKLLNKLLGGDIQYLQKYFTLRRANTSFTLVPKRKRMSKFIHDISISMQIHHAPWYSEGYNGKRDKRRGSESVNIQINNKNDQSTTIRIVETKKYNDLRKSDCVNITREALAACRLLMAPTDAK